MYLSIFLHFYQPSYQQPDILEAIVNQSYRPLLRVFKQNPTAHVTININGGLLDLLKEHNYQDVIDDFGSLLKKGQIELTGSAKYHAFLPLIPREEQIRQVKLNEESLKNYFGDDLKLRGFFPPELVYSFELAQLIEELDYEWIAAPQIAFGPERPAGDCLYRVKGLDQLKIYFRDKKASVLVLSGLTRSVKSFVEEIGNQQTFGYADSDQEASRYPLRPNAAASINGLSGGSSRDRRSILGTATGASRCPADDHSVPVDVVRRGTRLASPYTLAIMDAETFGHHRPGLEKLLNEIFRLDRFNCLQVSEIADHFTQIEEVEPRASTWSNEEQDFWLDKEKGVAAKNPFLLWKDPSNPIHQLQWEFVEWVIRKVKSQKSKVKGSEMWGDWEYARHLLDQALSSDQFWWASAKPWWSLEMVELGAFKLREVVKRLCSSGDSGALGSLDSKPNPRHRRGQGAVRRPLDRLGAANGVEWNLRSQGSPSSPYTNTDSSCEEWLIKAEDYYRKILDLAFEWQRSGKIRRAHQEASKAWKKTPFKKRTPAEWFNQMILEFEDEMKKAAANLEFEKAIKWRDAIIKLKNGSDPYDALHVVDELWSVRKIPSVKPFLQHKPAEFSKFASKHFEPMENKVNSKIKTYG